jgi:hypothetical protein
VKVALKLWYQRQFYFKISQESYLKVVFIMERLKLTYFLPVCERRRKLALNKRGEMAVQGIQ